MLESGLGTDSIWKGNSMKDCLSLNSVVWHTHPLDVDLLTGIVESDDVLFVLDWRRLRRHPTVPLPLAQPLCHGWGTQGEIFSVETSL